MKKIGLLLVLFAAAGATAQQSDSLAAPTVPGTLPTATSFPFERVQTPTHADLYCAGFVNQNTLPNVNFVAAGLQTPNTTKFANGDLIYLSGKGYETGQTYSIVRELRNPDKNELFAGQNRMLKAMGQPYSELAQVRVIDTRSKMAVARVEFSCEPVVPGDIAIPYAEKSPIAFHPPVRFDRFAPASAKTSGRIVMAKDFDSELGTGMKVYLNVGANQGVKAGDYFRAVRQYEADLKDPVDSLSFKATETEDTQRRPASTEPNFLTRTKGPEVHVADLPRRAVGEVVILSTTSTTATAMIVYALEDLHVGDNVEFDEQQ
jgi:hypothetical protein